MLIQMTLYSQIWIDDKVLAKKPTRETIIWGDLQDHFGHEQWNCLAEAKFDMMKTFDTICKLTDRV